MHAQRANVLFDHGRSSTVCMRFVHSLVEQCDESPRLNVAKHLSCSAPSSLVGPALLVSGSSTACSRCMLRSTAKAAAQLHQRCSWSLLPKSGMANAVVGNIAAQMAHSAAYTASRAAIVSYGPP